MELILYTLQYKCHHGIPVATVAINGAKNAAILASQIIGISNEEIKNKLESYKASLKEGVLKKDQRLQETGYENYQEEIL